MKVRVGAVAGMQARVYVWVECAQPPPSPQEVGFSQVANTGREANDKKSQVGEMGRIGGVSRIAELSTLLSQSKYYHQGTTSVRPRVGFANDGKSP